MKQCFFAVDLGATSGRTILGTFTPEGLEMEDVNRFPNHLIETGGHFYWDIYEQIGRASCRERMWKLLPSALIHGEWILSV